MKLVCQAALLAVIAAPATAQDGAKWTSPPSDQPTIRYVQGVPTLDLERESGGVLITPLIPDHGRITFGVAVYNHGFAPANFGPENVAAAAGGVDLPVLTARQLVANAKHRAFWAELGTIAATALVAGVASTAHSYTSYHTAGITSYGTIFFGQAVVRDNTPGVVGAGLAAGAGGAALVSIRNRLDQTIAQLGQDVLQTTTVDPEGGYGGRIVLDKPAVARGDTGEVRLAIRWNGADYSFIFRRGEAGQAMVPVGGAMLQVTPASYRQITTPSPLASQLASAPAPVGSPRLASSFSTSPGPIRPQMSEAERYAALLRAAQPQ